MADYWEDIHGPFFKAISKPLQLATFGGEDLGSADRCLSIVVVLVLPEYSAAPASDNTVPERVCLPAAGRDPDEYRTVENKIQSCFSSGSKIPTSLRWWDWDTEESDVYPGVTSELAKCMDGIGPLTSSIWKVQWCMCVSAPSTYLTSYW
ncbi:hypothetical protein llap_4457 [Limosa lapponica baueri]|uniref:Uncharacterized protein n=1 Tax=Limosa lapponica baueri TaxID=1758121 RepID=A0A2I0UGS2_LIMLA|nr:hypothetical protein llap_4457 [Limosa lapponica baueri]